MVPPRRTRPGYTLLEVLLALGVVAVLMGISVPYLAGAFGKSEAEEAADRVGDFVRQVHSGAVERSEARRIAIQPTGLATDIDSLPAVRLPKGWSLEVRRMAESKFRKPEKTEIWTFNSAGICEPLSLRIRGPGNSMELTFDPLTGLVVDE